MTKNLNTQQSNYSEDDLSREQEALWEALNSCDMDTYLAVISLLDLKATGSQHE